jgi:hypothetical protein
MLVSLATFRNHLKGDNSPAEDPDLVMKIAQAEEIVLAYIARTDDESYTATIAAWTEDTVPRSVQAAILMQALELYRFRGDDEKGPERDHGDMSPSVKAVLTASGYRRPVVA